MAGFYGWIFLKAGFFMVGFFYGWTFLKAVIFLRLDFFDCWIFLWLDCTKLGAASRFS